jgi:Mg-chelatase subunit ChlD
MPELDFSHPWYLAVAVIAAGAAVLVHRSSLAGLPPERRRICLLVRVVMLGAFGLALAGPSFSLPARGLEVLFLLDRSASIPPEAQARQLALVRDAARQIPPHVRVGVGAFGAVPAVVVEPRAAIKLDRIREQVNVQGTDLAAALRFGTAYLSPDAERRLVVVSDGNETTGDALEAAAAAAADGVEIDAVPIEVSHPREVLLERLDAPPVAKRGEPLELRLVGRSTASFQSTVRLLRDGELVAQKPWKLKPGVNVLTFSQSLAREGVHTWEAILEAAGDEIPDNNRALSFTRVSGKPRVLVVEGRHGEGVPLASALRERSLQVERAGVASLPSSAFAYSGIDSLVLVNVRADQVSPEQMRLVRSAVRDLGVGLVMVGGDQSLTAGGWRGAPVEEALPVEMQAPRRHETPEIALVLVIDSSSSMGAPLGATDKLSYARQAAQAVVPELRPEDELGVVAFADAPTWVVPLAKNRNRDAAVRSIDAISAGGGTNLYPALVTAYEALLRSRAAIKHMLVLTDGQSVGGDFLNLAERMARNRVGIATVGVGEGADGKLLSAIAQRAGGRYYPAVRWEALPLVFQRETRLASRAALVEEPFRPRSEGDSELLKPLPAAPPLLGYVVTTAREAAGVEVPLWSHRGDPLLATWRYVLGKAAVVTSDAQARWAAPWMADGGGYFSLFWSRLVRSTLRTSEDQATGVQVVLSGGNGEVVVDAVSPSGEYRNGLSLRGRVSGPEGGETLHLSQTGPGRYEGRFRAGARGQYLVSLQGLNSDEPNAMTVAGAAAAYSPEFARLESNGALLRAIADRTGGQVFPVLGSGLHDEHLRRLFRPGKPARTMPREAWAACLGVGLLLLPLDIGLRRLLYTRSELSAAVAPVLGAVLARLPGNRRSSDQPEERMGRLREAKLRVRNMSAPPSARWEAIPRPENGRAEPPSASASPAVQEEGSATRRLLQAKRRASGAREGTVSPTSEE